MKHTLEVEDLRHYPIKMELGDSMSEAEFFNFCSTNEDLKLERDKNGNILLMAPTFSETGGLEAGLIGELFIWNKKHQLGKVFSSQAGFNLPNGAVRAPDASFISHKRLDELTNEKRQKFYKICPDFVAEIRSENDRMPALLAKMDEYMENGCLLAYLIDPTTKTAHVFRPEKDTIIINNFKESLGGYEVLPGFELPLQIFE